MAIELKRNPDTGIVEAFEGDEKVGEVVTMGDQMDQEETKGNQELNP